METWIKIFDGGAYHLDVNADERTNLQLVLQGDTLLSKLYRAGMIPLTYSQQEFLLRGYHAELRQVTPTATQTIRFGGIWYPWDFYRMISEDWLGGAYEVAKSNGVLVLKKLSFRQGFSGPNGPIWYGEPGGVYHRTYIFEREYILELQ